MKAKKLIICHLLLLIYFFMFSTIECRSDTNQLDTQAKGLKIIIDFSERLCAVPIESKSSNLELSGGIKIDLGKITKQLADLGFSGAAKYQSSKSQGVLQKDITGLLKKGIDCKMEIFKILEAKLLTKVKPTKPLPKAKPKPAEPLLRISYQKWEHEIIVVFENIGDAPANWFTADITSSEPFSFGHSSADFDLNSSGRGSSGVGTWTVISGKNILPQQKGMVIFKFDEGKPALSPPKVKSDSKYIFLELNLSWGPTETTKK